MKCIRLFTYNFTFLIEQRRSIQSTHYLGCMSAKKFFSLEYLYVFGDFVQYLA